MKNKETGQWTEAKLASYIDCDGRLDDKRLLHDINAEIGLWQSRARDLLQRFYQISKAVLDDATEE